MPKIGIIAGSGFYEMEGVEVKELRKLTTPYGEPSDMYRICDISGREVAFLSRHGTPHHIPPHRINYRANIWGFRELGVERILSVNAVGGISGRLRPGDVVIADQIVDMTHGRASTFYDENEVLHIDFTVPFCNELRAALINAGKESGTEIKESGTYICVNGPRLETRAEIGYFSIVGADIVGMTVMPEACLARELELCLACIAVVTNYAAGISESGLTTTEVKETMKLSMERITNLIGKALAVLPESRTCDCRNALKEAKM
jgi:5'-methylthioadenosine phosphorylase